MNCPVCKIGMIVVEQNGVELDYCVRCGGVWFDREELEHLIETIHLNIESLHLEEAPGAAKTEKPRRCPLCRRRMLKIAAGDSDPVILDYCKTHGGYWFDGNELPLTLKKSLPESDWKNVMGFIGDIFTFDERKKEDSK